VLGDDEKWLLGPSENTEILADAAQLNSSCAAIIVAAVAAGAVCRCEQDESGPG
jgi:hypothetical protein